MINSQRPDKISFGNLIENIKKGKYVIPDFQREFDWQPWDISNLMKSIFMDYYIGTLLLWEGKKANYDVLDCKPIFAFEGDSNPEFIVLDGQQRITALHYAIFQPHQPFRKRKSRFYYFIKLDKFIDDNYDDAFFYTKETKHFNDVLADKNKQYEYHLFPIHVLVGGTWDLQNWILEYRSFWQEKLKNLESSEIEETEELAKYYQKYIDGTEKIKTDFFNILNNYQISFIVLDEQLKIDKVCEIFTHINSRGVKLDTFDLLNAITRPKDIYLKDMYRKTSAHLEDTAYPGFELKSYILMVMSIIKQKYCSPMYLYYLVPEEVKTIKKEDGSSEKVVLVQDANEFKSLWEIAVSALEIALKTLKNPRDLGAVSNRFLPYPSIIPVLSAIKYHIKTTKYDNMIDINNKIHQWYWASIFQNRYSSAVESTTTKDYQDLIKWFKNNNDIIETVADFFRDYKLLALEKETSSNSSIYKAIFDLYIINGAKDWQSFLLPEYENIDDHHIVPKSWGKQMGLSSEINTILNRTPLSPETNRVVISDRMPNVYIAEMFAKNDEEAVYKALDSHLISKNCISILLRNPFTVDDYKEFIDERKTRILQEIENKIIKQSIDLPPDLLKLNEEIEIVELLLRDLIEEKLCINSVTDFKKNIADHIVEKVIFRITKEFNKNPSLKLEKENEVDYYFEFLDFQELNAIITAKNNWASFETYFGGKENLTIEFNQLANLRNAIRHTRTLDKITGLKGEASLLWFKKQLI